MSWRRVAFSVAFAVGMTALGRVLPMRLGYEICLPGTLASGLLPEIRNPRLDISLHIWVWLFANLSAWALLGEAVLLGWHRLRQWETKRAAHALESPLP